jgi:hypothetical protein
VKVQDQVQANKIQGSRTRSTSRLLTIVVLSVVAGSFFEELYFVRELLLFVAIVAVLVFFGATLSLPSDG